MNAPTPDLPSLIPIPRSVYTAIIDYRDACRACPDCHRAAVDGRVQLNPWELSKAKWDALARLECAMGEMP